MSDLLRAHGFKAHPEPWDPGDLVFFLHVPKTAGTSLTSYLRAQFPGDRVITPQHLNAAGSQDQEWLRRAALVYGHFPRSVYGPRLPRQPNYLLTMLRDPVQHIVSVYFHLKRDPRFLFTARGSDGVTEDMAAELNAWVQRASFLDFVRSPRWAPMFADFQSRYLVRGVVPAPDGLAGQALREQALEILEGLPVFGLVEQMGASLAAISRQTGWPAAGTTPATNRAPNRTRWWRPRPRGAKRKHLMQLLAQDFALYDHAVRLFSGRFSG